MGREAGTGNWKRKEGKEREKKRKNTNEETHVKLMVVLFTFSQYKSKKI